MAEEGLNTGAFRSLKRFFIRKIGVKMGGGGSKLQKNTYTLPVIPANSGCHLSSFPIVHLSENVIWSPKYSSAVSLTAFQLFTLSDSFSYLLVQFQMIAKL